MKDHISVRALVIDDDDAICRRLGDWLNADGFEVGAYHDPAVGLASARQQPFDVALIDLRLGELDGAEVLATLHTEFPLTRLMAMAAFPQPDQESQARASGAAELLTKPVQRDALLAAVRRQLLEVGIVARSEEEFATWLGEHLRHTRTSAGLKQADVAAAVGISAAQLSQIESGRTGTSAWTLARIAAVLHVPLASLLRTGQD